MLQCKAFLFYRSTTQQKKLSSFAVQNWFRIFESKAKFFNAVSGNVDGIFFALLLLVQNTYLRAWFEFTAFTVRVLVIDKTPFDFVGLNGDYRCSDTVEGLPGGPIKNWFDGIFFLKSVYKGWYTSGRLYKGKAYWIFMG